MTLSIVRFHRHSVGSARCKRIDQSRVVTKLLSRSLSIVTVTLMGTLPLATLQTLRCSPPYEDSVGDSTPPLQTIVQFTKLPHDSLNEDWHLGTTAYECLCRSFAFTEIP